MARDKAITLKRQKEVTCALSNGDKSNGRTPNTDLKAFLKSNISKTVCFRDKVAREH